VRSIFIVFALAACGTPLSVPRYAAQPTSALELIPAPPPPARVEAIPHAPRVAGAAWIDGEWTWHHKRWAWVCGRWVVPPHGAKYSPWIIVRATDGALYQAHGAWRDAHGEAIAEPAPLAVADVSAGAIVDAAGNTFEPGRVLKAATTFDEEDEDK
jgi:hypothetical protein